MTEEDDSPSWFGRKKEEKVLKLSEKHLEKVVEVVEAMKDAVNSFKRKTDEFRGFSEKAINKEREADREKGKVLKELATGHFPQVSGEAIMRLILTTDDIAENARAAVEKLVFLNPNDVDQEIRTEMEKLANFAYEAVNLLKKVYSISLYENLEEAIGKTEQVEKMEEKVDHFRAEKLTPKIIEWANKSDKTGDVIILVEVEGNIEEVVDQAENSVDVIREIVLGTV